MGRSERRLFMLGLAAFSFAPANVHASAFKVRENSAESLATSYAGNASRADDVATVFNNPAGMNYLPGTQWEVGATVVAPSVHFAGNATLQGKAISQGPDTNAGQVALVPHAYGVFDLSDRLKAGIAVTAPFGNALDYANDWPGRYVNLKTAAISVDLNPNLSYRITDHISIGGGVSLQDMKLKLSTALAQFAIFGPGTPDGVYMLNVDNFAVGYNFGILAEPFEGTRIGITYRSGISHPLKGKLSFSAATLPGLGLVGAPASAKIDVPANIGGSITQQLFPDLSLSAEIQLSQWHTFKEVSVNAPPNPQFLFPEGYRDSWMFSVGGVYRWNDDWSLLAGTGFDESPVTDAYRDTGVPDAGRIMVGLGVSTKLSGGYTLNVGYSHYFSAEHASMDSSINALDPISGIVLHGRYTNSIDYLGVSLRASVE